MFAACRHISALLLLLTASCLLGRLDADFSLDKGPLLRKKLADRFLRIIQGGDGYFYIFKGTSGHYWNFGSEGERSLQIIRFSPELQPIDTLRIRRWGSEGQIRNVYEVIPSPDGIAILNIARSPHTGMAALMLSEPVFGAGETTFKTRILDDLPGFSLGLDQPGLRYEFSPDSNFVLLAWRRISREELTDNSLACMILDRNLQVVQEPFMPFRRFDQSVSLREMYILDPQHLLFTAQTYSGGSAFQGPATVAFGLLHYAVGDATTRVISFSNSKQVPVEMKILTNVPGKLIVSGWYLDQENERREAGVFIGEITRADTLENLHLYPLKEEMRDALIRREKKSGAVAIRSSYQSEFLAAPGGFTFVLHLRGFPDKGIELHSPGSKPNNSLHVWQYGLDFQLLSNTVTGFLNLGRAEMMET
ncbi:MAG TPA: hypothetical protein VHS96_01410, partial [Bacteroidia bacterium]|nr:hypothetical protein [Bacteroidia bacterium]